MKQSLQLKLSQHLALTPQLQQSIQGLEDATRSLEGLVDEVRSSPRDFIGRPPTRELEVQP